MHRPRSMWFLGVLRNTWKPLCGMEWRRGKVVGDKMKEIKREPDHHGYSVWTPWGLCFLWPKMREDILQYIVAGTKTRFEGGTNCTPVAGQVWLGLYSKVSSLRRRHIICFTSWTACREPGVYLLYKFFEFTLSDWAMDSMGTICKEEQVFP